MVVHTFHRINGWIREQKSFAKTSGYSGLNSILRLLRIVGLGPFLLRKDTTEKRLIFLLFIYNICLALSLTYNMVLLVYDEKLLLSSVSDGSVLTRISYDLIDMMENFHHFFISIRSMVFWRRGQSMMILLKKINQKFDEMKVNFNKRHFQIYIWLKTSALAFAYTVVLPVVFISCPRPGTSGHPNVWFLAVLPLLLNSILETAFGAVTLILYQRFWTVNEFLTTCLHHYKEEALMLNSRFRHFGDYEPEFNKINYEFLEQRKMRKAEPFERWIPIIRTAPLLAMMKHPEEVFASSFYRRTNLVEFVRKLKALHFGLYEITDSVNSVFGYNLLFVFITSFFGCIINLYFVVIFHISTIDVKRYVSCWCWMTYYFFRVLHVVISANKASKEAKKTQYILHVFLNQMNFADTRLKEEVKGFCPQTAECRVEFKAAGFFSIESGTIFQFVAGVLSNAVFIIQFYQSES